jgi:hypothetical protein
MSNLSSPRPRRAVAALAAALTLPCAVASAALPAHAAGGGVAENGFTTPVMMADSYGGIEPSIAVDGHGRIYISPIQLPTQPTGTEAASTTTVTGSPVWRSGDGGATFQGPARAVGDPAGGEDTSLALDATNNLYQADLWLGNVAMAVSTDGGQSFVANQSANAHAGADRPWLVYSAHDNVLYELYNGLEALHVARSAPLLTPQAGLAFPVDVPVATQCAASASTCASLPVDQDCSCPPGGIAVDQGSGEVYISYGGATGGSVGIAHSTDQGLTWAKSHIPGTGVLDDGRSVSYNFQPIGVDSAGNVYVAWAEAQGATLDGNGNLVAAGGVAIRFSRSTDHGQSWSTPVTASTTTASNIFPALALGAPGTAYVGYLGAPGATGDPALVPDTTSWDLMVSTSRDALDDTPQFSAAVAVQGMHQGCIEADPAGCEGTTNGSGLGDFFSMTTGPDGRLDIAYSAGNVGSYTQTTPVSSTTTFFPDANVYFTSHAG